MEQKETREILKLARKEASKGNHKESLKLYAKAYKIKPDSINDSLFGISDSKAQTADFIGALTALHKAIELDTKAMIRDKLQNPENLSRKEWRMREARTLKKLAIKYYQAVADIAWHLGRDTQAKPVLDILERIRNKSFLKDPIF